VFRFAVFAARAHARVAITAASPVLSSALLSSAVRSPALLSPAGPLALAGARP
jgi:hypothetical protein